MMLTKLPPKADVLSLSKKYYCDLIHKQGRLNGKEFSFARKFMGKSRKEMARDLLMTEEQLITFEVGNEPILSPFAERWFRLQMCSVIYGNSNIFGRKLAALFNEIEKSWHKKA